MGKNIAAGVAGVVLAVLGIVIAAWLGMTLAAGPASNSE